MTQTTLEAKTNDNYDNTFLIGSEGYLNISWKPDEETLYETPCFGWKPEYDQKISFSDTYEGSIFANIHTKGYEVSA